MFHTIQEKCQEEKGVETVGGKGVYILSMFPYPSGELHMGHVRVYTISDTLARYHRARGSHVLHPMGWDAFGLPSENAAIERGLSPAVWTHSNISQMRRQLDQLHFQFDWEREVVTCAPDYYRWTQWLFIQLYQRGLAYQKEAYVNWDPVDETVLANEQVDAEGRSWRSGAKVEWRRLNQWFLRITHYKRALLEGLVGLEWPDKVKQMQANWIGRSSGYLLDFQLREEGEGVGGGEERVGKIRVYTTKPEKVFDVAFLAVSAEHEVSERYGSEVLAPIPLSSSSSSSSSGSRGESVDETGGKHSEGVRGCVLPVRAVHPITGQLLPVLRMDYVQQTGGTGAMMGVPALNKRDALVADRWHCDIPCLLSSDRARVLAPGHMNGMSWEEAKTALHSEDWIEGKEEFRLRDWLISRQRYWGCPIPVVHCPSCGSVPVEEQQLPVRLPPDLHLTGRGHSPLRTCEEFLTTVCPRCGSTHARRETDTMDTFIDSSWYYLRYCDPHNSSDLCRAEEARRYLPVDIYIGGVEHAVLHLLYARFISHFLHELGVTPHPEPFTRLLTQGVVTGKTYRVVGSQRYLSPQQVEEEGGEGGKLVEKETQQQVEVFWEKMSKSRYNGVSPQAMVEKYGADVVRLFLFHNVSVSQDLQWDEKNISALLRWKARLEDLLCSHSHLYHNSQRPPQEAATGGEGEAASALLAIVRKAVSISTTSMESRFNFSVIITQLMKLTKALQRCRQELSGSQVYHDALKVLLALMHPMAPQISIQLWKELGEEVHSSGSPISWPDVAVSQQQHSRNDRGSTTEYLVKFNDRRVCSISVSSTGGDAELQVREVVLADPRVQELLRQHQSATQVVNLESKLVLISK